MVSTARHGWSLRGMALGSAVSLATIGLVASGAAARTVGTPSALPSQAPVGDARTPYVPHVARPGSPSPLAIANTLLNKQGSTYNLDALTGTSANDVWVAGTKYTGSTATPLTLHYDGSTWTQVPTPTGQQRPALVDIDARTPDDVWAVGQQDTGGGSGAANFAMHWDGAAWSVVPTPDPVGQYVHLAAVSVISPSLAIASGTVCGDGPCSPEVLRWNGSRWRIVTKAPVDQIDKAQAASPTDAFAVGSRDGSAYSARWTGSRWRSLTLPSTPNGENLNDVTNGGSGAVWEVGAAQDSQGYANGPYVVHWTGSKWRQVPIADQNWQLVAKVTADSPFDAWITNRMDLQHWDGTSFRPVSSPLQRETGAAIHDIAAFDPSDAWMIGQYDGPSGYVSQILHYDGSHWSASRTFGVTRTSANDDVDALSRDDAWLLGSTQTSYQNGHSRISHWDGATWTKVPHPDPGDGGAWLSRIDAQSADDVWTVGAELKGPYTEKTLIEHWDGSAWSVVASEDMPVDQNYLAAVSADSSTDAWAVGHGETRYGEQVKALAEHWDGASWQLVALPNGVRGLEAVDAVTPSDAWATGYRKTAGGPSSVVLHWDGTAWTVVEHQASSDYNSTDYASVVALSPQDVWVLGSASTYHGAEGKPQSTLALHWDGTTWSQVATPTRKDPESLFTDASPDAKGGVWAVGYEFDHIIGQETPLIEHWDGAAWTVAAMQPQKQGTTLQGVTAPSRNLAWAVGAKAANALILHWNGTLWRG